MKKKMIILILLIISFTIFVNTGNRTLTCNELFYKKLWINKTNNFSVCIPFSYDAFDAYGHRISMDFMSNIFIVEDNEGKKYIMDSDINIGSITSDFEDLIYINECFGKSNKKDCFNYNKNNKEHIKIINSIKPLTEK